MKTLEIGTACRGTDVQMQEASAGVELVRYAFGVVTFAGNEFYRAGVDRRRQACSKCR